MSEYTVLIPLKHQTGEYVPGDPIEIEPTTPAEQADLDTLIRYKILMAVPSKAKPSKTVSK